MSNFVFIVINIVKIIGSDDKMDVLILVVSIIEISNINEVRMYFLDSNEFCFFDE